MTYTPKPGDRVTSPLLVGEWTVGVKKQPAWFEVYDDKGNPLKMYVGNLVPVVPPPPPEPPVGSVVWAQGRYWYRIDTAMATHWNSGVKWSLWGEIVGDAVPVVPVTEVADWLGCSDPGLDNLRRQFVERFGSFKEDTT